MAFVNLPPNLQDMFYSLSDRISKLETGPNQPGYDADAAQATAVSAQSLALTSQSVATNASLQASNAAVQAVQAQSQATIASTQATYAVTTANGKNTVAYGTSSPPSGTHTTGDLYFQFNGSNQVIAQYTWNGSSWVSNPITSTVIASINAGTITSGTITGIEYNNGTGTFHVTPAGALTASSANITGTIVATAGYIGNTGGGSYWAITSSGITGYGSANITGGLISGSSINIGSGTFQVDAAGNLNASSATVTGTISTSNLTATGGHIGGFTIGSTYLSGSGAFFLNSSTGDATFNSVTLGFSGIYNWSAAGALTAASLSTSGTADIGGNLQVHSITSLSATGVVWSSSNSRFYLTTSTERHKDNITPIPNADYLSKILELEPVTFNYKPEYTDNPNQIISGLIAEKVAAIPEFSTTVNLDKDGLPESISYDRLAVFFIPALKQINDRLTKLEGK